MKAILFATGRAASTPGCQSRTPAFLHDLVDRPFLQHLVELLVEGGVESLDVISEEEPDRVQQILGDGTRWGVSIRHHAAPPHAPVYRGLLQLEVTGDEPILLAHADVILDPGIWSAGDDLGPDTHLYCHPAAAPDERLADVNWTGWARVLPGTLAALAGGDSRAAVLRRLLAHPGTRTASFVEDLFEASDLDGLHRSIRRVLDGTGPAVRLMGRTLSPGVRVGRGVQIDPGAVIEGPAFLGADTRIGPGVRIGPHTVIGAGSVVDTGCEVSHSVVSPHSYLGPSLTLDGHILEGTRLHDLESGSTAHLVDGVLVDDLSRRSLTEPLARAIGRVVADVVSVGMMPLRGWLASRARTRSEDLFAFGHHVCAPAADSPSLWRRVPSRSLTAGARADLARICRGRPLATAFLARLIAGAEDVRDGWRSWFGVAPRDLDEVTALEPGIRDLLLEARPGVFTEAGLVSLQGMDEEARVVADLSFVSSRVRFPVLDLVIRSARSLVGGRLHGESPSVRIGPALEPLAEGVSGRSA